MRISTGVDLDCAPAEAFAWVDRPDRAARWQTNVRDGVVVTETPGRVGTTFRETVEEGGRSTEVLGTITEYAPPSVIAFDLRSAYTTATVRYVVTPRGRGAHLAVDGTVRLRSVPRLLEPVVGRLLVRRIRRQFDAELRLLRTLCAVEPGTTVAPHPHAVRPAGDLTPPARRRRRSPRP